MKTYKKIIEKSLLSIEYDEHAESPRSDSNLGYFISCDDRHGSPDKHEEIKSIVKETGEVAENLRDHKHLIWKRIKEELGENVIAIFPITAYEHGGITYSLGTAHGFDNSNNSFYIITDESQKETGIEKKDFEKVIGYELTTYNEWANGEIYRFTLYNDEGEIEDSCGGFYEIEAMRDYLPKEWAKENLEDYLIN